MQTPKEGKVTFDSEGTEGGYFHSRKLHVPTASSGLTLGRGYENWGQILRDPHNKVIRINKL